MLNDFFTAVKSGNMKDIKSVLQNNVIDLNQTDSDGKTALYYAVSQNYLHVAEFLLQYGVSTKIAIKNDHNNNNNSANYRIILLLEDPSLKLSHEMKKLLLDHEKSLIIKTLDDLETQISTLQDILGQENHQNRLSRKAQIAWQSIATTFSAALSANCFYYGFYKPGIFLTAMTSLMGVINYRFYDQSHRLNCYRENLSKFINKIESIGNECNFSELKQQLQNPNSFLKIAELLDSLKIVVSSYKTTIAYADEENNLDLRQVNLMSEKLSNFNLFKTNSKAKIKTNSTPSNAVELTDIISSMNSSLFIPSGTL